MKKRIAIPIEGNMLSEHFGHCEAFAFIDTNDTAIINKQTISPPEHQPGIYPRWIAENGATDVIAGGMGPQAINILNGLSVNVYIGANVDYPEKIVTDFLNNGFEGGNNSCNHDSKDHSCRHN